MNRNLEASLNSLSNNSQVKGLTLKDVGGCFEAFDHKNENVQEVCLYFL